MANLFRKEVETIISSKMGELTHPIQGYIPRGQIDHINWVAKQLRVPNPKGGIHPSNTPEAGYLEFTDVPLPKNQIGIIEAIASLVKGGDRACTVAFKGGNLAFPVIINLLSLLHSGTDRQVETTKDRSSSIANKAATGAAGVALSTVTKLPLPIANTVVDTAVKAGQQAIQAAKGALEELKKNTSNPIVYAMKDRYSTTAKKK